MGEGDAVLRCDLRAEAVDEHLPPLELARRDAGILDPVPSRQVEGVLVPADAFEGRDRIQLAVAAVEPQPVLHDRTAVGDAAVVRLDDAGRFLEVRSRRRRRQLVVEVVPLRPLAGGVDEGRAAELVAARARDDVHDRAADFHFTETARDVGRHFVGADGVEDVGGDAAAVERGRDGHPVHGHAAFVGRAAARAEEGHRRRRVQAVVVNGDARRQVEQRADRPGCGNRRDHFLVDGRLHVWCSARRRRAFHR